MNEHHLRPPCFPQTRHFQRRFHPSGSQVELDVPSSNPRTAVPPEHRQSFTWQGWPSAVTSAEGAHTSEPAAAPGNLESGWRGVCWALCHIPPIQASRPPGLTLMQKEQQGLERRARRPGCRHGGGWKEVDGRTSAGGACHVVRGSPGR